MKNLLLILALFVVGCSETETALKCELYKICQGEACTNDVMPEIEQIVFSKNTIRQETFDGSKFAYFEEDYIEFIMDESLSDSEQDYLAGVLQQDNRLSDILDKVITTASEFSGAGEVEGPGTGVSDSIPARLSDGEFVFTKKATDQIGADNLQRMMDDAERAYDGGYQMKAVGGMMEDEDPENLGMSQTQEEIEKLMMGANRMPSLQ